MTTAKKADKAAAEKGSGGGSRIGNEGGTATGPGSSSASAKEKGNQHDIGGAGSPKTTRNRPGHKANG